MVLIPGITADELRPKIYVTEDVFYPTVAHEGDAGSDLRLRIEGNETLEELVSKSRMYHSQDYCYINGKEYSYRKLKDIFSGGVTDDGEELSPTQVALLLEPGEGRLIPTGVYIQLPDLSKYGPYVPMLRIVPRSGLGGKLKVTISNSPGTIDKPYTGEIKVALYNASKECHLFTYGTRAVQMIYEPVFDQSVIGFDRVNSRSQFDESVRGSEGFGSSGVL